MVTMNSQVGTAAELESANLDLLSHIKPTSSCRCYQQAEFPLLGPLLIVNSHMFVCPSQTAYTIPILAFAFVCHPEVLPVYTELLK